MSGLLKREFKLVSQSWGDFLLGMGFFLSSGLLLPFALGPESETLSRYGPGLIWILNLLVICFSVETFFQQDHADGSFTLLRLSVVGLWKIYMAKVIVLILVLGGLLLSGSLLLAVVFQLSPNLVFCLGGTLALALPGMISMGAMVVCLTLNSNSSGLLRPFLLFPLYIPLLVFGVGICEAILLQQSPLPFLKSLLGVSLLYLILSIPVAGKILTSSH